MAEKVENYYSKYIGEYDEYFEFLDELRASGITNMFGATPYLMSAFDYLSYDEARTILKAWMETFAIRHDKTPSKDQT